MGRIVGKSISFLCVEGHFSFLPGDEVPEHLEKYITAERVWAKPGEYESVPDDAANEDDLPLEKMSYRKLLDIAQDRGIEFHGNPKKDEVLAALTAPEPAPVLIVEDAEEEQFS